MNMNYKIIATGSQGNAVVVNDNILVDCGVSFKALKEVYKDLQIVLLTHIHTDHFKPQTLKRLSDERPALRFGCCQWLVKPLVDAGVPKQSIDVYEIGKIYDYGVFKVSPVKLYHNVENSGYRLFFDGEKAIYMTDTGHLQGITAKDYNLYLVEANYDENDLEQRIIEKTATGEYCYELHVAERHLSHEQASEWLMKNMGQNSDYVFLHGHKDREQNENEVYTDDKD